MENTEIIVESNKNYRFKIDWKKWKADVDSLLTDRKDARERTEKKGWSAIDYYYDSRLTMLYSIRAQARGRIHRSTARLNWSDWKKLPCAKVNPVAYDLFTQNNGAAKFLLTLDDQASYIGDSWKEYEQKIS